MSLPHFTRTRDDYLISTDPSLLSLSAINDAFASPDMYWCQRMPEAALSMMMRSSLCLGLYALSSPPPLPSSSPPPAPTPAQIGLARLITDHTTFAYLTDVYVLPAHQGQGLGSWLIACVDEILAGMPHLKRAMLVTSGSGEAWYGERLGMRRMEPGTMGLVTLHRLGRGTMSALRGGGKEEKEGGTVEGEEEKERREQKEGVTVGA